LVIIVAYKVEFLLEGIKKGGPSGSCIEYHILIFTLSLLITLPPIFEMGKGFYECIGNILILEKKGYSNSHPTYLTISIKNLHLFGLQIMGYQTQITLEGCHTSKIVAC